MIDESYLVIAMSTTHRDYIKEKFDIDVPLFNEIAINEETPVLDLSEKEGNDTLEKLIKDIDETIDSINKKIPKFYENLKNF